MAHALIGFNLGVETAQVAVVLLVTPPLKRLAAAPRGPRIERALSIVIAA